MTLGDLGALFNPGMRHELAERRSRALRREEEGHGRDGDLRIDFESGVAVINVEADAEPADADQADPTDPTDPDPAESDESDPAAAASRSTDGAAGAPPSGSTPDRSG